MKPKQAGTLRLLWACVRGVFVRLRRAEGRRQVAVGKPIMGAMLAGVSAREMLGLIRQEPSLDRRMALYAREVDRRVAPGGRLRGRG